MSSPNHVLEDEADDRPGDVVDRGGGRDVGRAAEDDREAGERKSLATEIVGREKVKEEAYLTYLTNELGHLSEMRYPNAGAAAPMRKKNVNA